MAEKIISVSYPYEINGIDVAVYGYLFILNYNKHLPSPSYVSVWQLAAYLDVSAGQIKESLERMGDKLARRSEHDLYVIDLKVLYKQKRKFVSLPFEAIHCIVNSGERHRFKILEFFVWLLKSVDLNIESMGQKYFMTNKPLAYFSKVTGVHRASLVKWERVLEDMGIIYVFRASDTKTPNFVGLVGNKEYIDAYAKSQHIYKRNPSQDKTMSLFAKHRAVCNGAAYTKSSALLLYSDIMNYNAIHPDKPLDLVIFDERFNIAPEDVSGEYAVWYKLLDQKYSDFCNGKINSDKEILELYKDVLTYNKDHFYNHYDLSVFENYKSILDNVSC